MFYVALFLAIVFALISKDLVFSWQRTKRRKTYPITRTNPNLSRVIIRCFDRRFSVAHRRFIRRELKLKRRDFYPIKLAGGPAALARREQMPEKCGAILEDIDLARKHHAISEIILIAHEDCRMYEKLVDRKLADPHIEKLDLPEAVRFLLEKYPDLKIRAFYARFTEKRQRIFFEEIEVQLKQHAAA